MRKAFGQNGMNSVLHRSKLSTTKRNSSSRTHCLQITQTIDLFITPGARTGL